MSSYGTSSSVVGSTRFCRMRAPVLLESWWKRTDLGEVALYSLTGTLTSPKLIAPDQIARAIQALYSERAVRSRPERSLAGGGERLYLTRWPAQALDQMWTSLPSRS